MSSAGLRTSRASPGNILTHRHALPLHRAAYLNLGNCPLSDNILKRAEDSNSPQVFCPRASGRHRSPDWYQTKADFLVPGTEVRTRPVGATLKMVFVVAVRWAFWAAKCSKFNFSNFVSILII